MKLKINEGLAWAVFSRRLFFLPPGCEVSAMGERTLTTQQLLLLLLLGSPLIFLATAFPLCTNLEAPSKLKQPLNFCSSSGYNETSCCDNHTDAQLMTLYQSYNVSDVHCTSFLKQILCAHCDPYAAFLFRLEEHEQLSVPFLCNSSSTSYCSRFWNACKNITIHNSPFTSLLQNGSSIASRSPVVENKTILSNLWNSDHEFCTAFGGSSGPGNFCYSGTAFSPPAESVRPDPPGICFERIDTDAYLNMVPHPDGSNRVFLASQDGKIWLADLPEAGSRKPLSLNKSNPFLDLSDRVTSTGEYGLLGLAFHPNFNENGRFFISYNCDRTLWEDCAGQCACNADVGCTLSQLGPDAGAIPCLYSSIIAEYSSNNSRSSPSKAGVADPVEVRRIFTMGLPYSTHHAGQILFGPEDNNLYFMMGDGGSSGDPFNFAQNKKSLLGKILRFNIDNIPDRTSISDQDLWGNYSIPSDNPFVNDTGSRPEIWAYGLRNPWRCTFDARFPLYFYCADVGQELYEEVNLISKGGNYGWRVFEGTSPYTPPRSPGGSTNRSSIQPIFPILQYDHMSVNPKEATASITGGFVSRSTEDACLYGRYIYADLYGAAIWAGLERPLGSGNYSTSRLPFNCSQESPLPCEFGSDKEPNFMFVLSFGEDRSRNIYLLGGNGVYKVSNPKGCNYTCNERLSVSPILPPSSSHNAAPSPSPALIPAANTSGSQQLSLGINIALWCSFVFSFLL